VNLSTWASRWGVSHAALADLRKQITDIPAPKVSPVLDPHTEAWVQTRVRLEASRLGVRLWRNNLGAVVDAHGNYIRYGLANESPAMNAVMKSSDLVGIRPVTLPGGEIFGQFIAREIKASGWKYTGTPREKAQLNFLELVSSMGGDACFATGEGTI
jgi:hypothetical protein